MGGYYIVTANGKSGPFSLEQLRAKTLGPQTLVWQLGYANWRSADEIAELQPILRSQVVQDSLRARVIPPTVDLTPGEVHRASSARLFTRHRVAGACILLIVGVIIWKATTRTTTNANPATSSPPVTDASPKEQRLILPLLTVHQDEGALINAELRISRSADHSSPLVVAVEEDTPGGAGAAIRASLWLAAMIAGLSHDDDLGGVHLSLRVTGAVDGPSAGGMLCLAILSALDGRSLPSDFAFTGAIMPDGSIGSVGGIQHKMRAAAGRGVSRIFIPDFARFETDEKSKQNVDLKELAATLGIRFVPVQDIVEVYQRVHGLPVPPQKPIPADVLDLPLPVESLLKKRYAEACAEIDASWAKLSAERQQAYRADVFINSALEDRSKADQAFRSGRLAYAAEQAQYLRFLLRGAPRVDELLRKQSTVDVATEIRFANPQAVDLVTHLPNALQLLERCQGKVSPVASQLCTNLGDYLLPLTASDSLHRRALNETNGKTDPAKLSQVASALRRTDLSLVQVMREQSETFVADASEQAALLPNLPTKPHAARTEQLLYGATTAAAGGFDANVAEMVSSSGVQVTADQTLTWMQDHDAEMISYAALPKLCANLHARVTSTPGSDPLILATAAQLHADSLGHLAAISVRWQQLDCSVDGDGELVIGRPDILNYLLNAARAKAIKNIAACRRLAVPCIQPVTLVQRADFERQAKGADAISVLGDYYRASLQAKTLAMLFVQPQK